VQDGVDPSGPADLCREGQHPVAGRSDLPGDILTQDGPGSRVGRAEGHVEDGPAFRGVYGFPSE